ncbi:hydrolase, partial [Pseudomonas aeruginosa]|nr:hydrolase [Pseudomonas aeruginosa]HEP9402485.1 hydrolase [Pseudomonas aeruginosa]
MRYPCPCCGYLTFDEEPCGTYEICPVCYWEDDIAQNKDPDYDGG